MKIAATLLFFSLFAGASASEELLLRGHHRVLPEACNSQFPCPSIVCVAEPCPQYTCQKGDCVLAECSTDEDCPQIVCVTEPCPGYVCDSGECALEDATCPVVSCLNPCKGKCEEGETCVTRTTRQGQCELCPVFVRCEAEPVPCPVVRCADPCVGCPEGNNCITRQSRDGQCDLCPIFSACTPSVPRGPKCGNNHCPKGQVCCNDSCGICTEEGGFCIQIACVDDP